MMSLTSPSVDSSSGATSRSASSSFPIRMNSICFFTKTFSMVCILTVSLLNWMASWRGASSRTVCREFTALNFEPVLLSEKLPITPETDMSTYLRWGAMRSLSGFGAELAPERLVPDRLRANPSVPVHVSFHKQDLIFDQAQLEVDALEVES